jgi:tetratricopeptide (TPR) repeat protein
VWWKQAWHGFRDEPLAGTGAGTFHLTNLRYRTTYLDEAREPHDLPLQFLSETGIVGLALFVLAAAALVRAARRRDAAELALALALPAYLVHALLDIDWDFLAVTAPALVAAGAVAARPAVGRRPSQFAGLIGAGVALAVLSSLFAVWLADRWTNESIAALDRPARAIELARRARSADPLAIDPLYWESVAENARGRPREAYALLRKATEIQPQNPEAWFRLGDFAYTSGCPRLALPALEKFAGLDPQDRKGSEHQAALDAVNSGKPSC